MKGKAMRFIHVDTNRFALNQMQKEISQIVPQAELHCFDRPEPGLAFAKAQGCDVLLTEIEFFTDRFGGIRLAKAMKEINPQVNIIFVTVCNEYEVSGELSDFRISSFIPKPWKPEALETVIQDLLHKEGF